MNVSRLIPVSIAVALAATATALPPKRPRVVWLVPHPPFGRTDLRALIVVASPQDLEDRFGLEPFDVARAVEAVRSGLGAIPSDVLADGGAVPAAVGSPTLNALAKRITQERYTLLHIVAHGQYARRSGETILYLADEDNQVDPVPASRFVERLSLSIP